MSNDPKARLVARNDFDGLACAALLRHRGLVDEVRFVSQRDIQDGVVVVGPDDIIANLPDSGGARLAFDRHNGSPRLPGERIVDTEAASVARVVFNHFGADAFPASCIPMLDAVDRIGAAQVSRDDVLCPSGWMLLGFLVDARTGLGRFPFAVSEADLMVELVSHCLSDGIDQILRLPGVVERVDLYLAQDGLFKEQIRRCSYSFGDLVVADLREEETVYVGNRFMVYALHPDCNISIHVSGDPAGDSAVFACGKSPLNRTSTLDVGRLMAEFGGGGHENAGACRVANDKAISAMLSLIERVNAAE